MKHGNNIWQQIPIDAKRYRWIWLLCLGILLMILSVPRGKERQVEKKEEPEKISQSTDYIEKMERQLEGILEEADGVGKATVMITAKGTGEKVIEKDKDQTKEHSSSMNGEEREVTKSQEETVISQQEDEELPYVKQELNPKIEGVLIIADGGDDPQVISYITEAVQALFGVEPHKIKVMKRKEI